jgi:DNA-binding beta-propeller fold protein YncE
MAHTLVRFTIGSLLAAITGNDFLLPSHPAPLELETRISLGDVRGRIDHLAIDLDRSRLYVAELGNDSIGVVDLKERRTVYTLTGLSEPQGIGYVPSADMVYVANAGDGTVQLFQGLDLRRVAQLALGEDADNIRVDDSAHRVYVGYGSGALAVIDTTSRTRIADIPLKAHPEGFQLESAGQRIFVNMPDAHQLAVVDRSTSKHVASWSTDPWRGNFPLALDAARQRVLAVFRHPARVIAFGVQDGRPLAALDTCGDADDVFVDPKRDRVYIACGDGFLDILASRGDGYVSIARIPTAAGARTALFVPEIDRLMLAVRASTASRAAVWVFRPQS